MLCIGHRGARGHAPENTLASFEAAIALGAGAVELDIQLCEGQPVVIHDDTLNRTTNGKGRVADASLARLRALDAGQGERIPLLNEVLDHIDRRAAVNIELKAPGSAAPVSAVIADYRNRGWDEHLFLVSAFDWNELAAFRQHDADTRIGLLFDEALSPAALIAATRELRSHAWHPNHRLITVELLSAARQQQQRVYTYTVNDTSRLHELKAWGVDGVFTDYPERALPFQTSDTTSFF